MDIIIVGRYSYSLEAIKDKTLKELKEMFVEHPENVLKEAQRLANPKQVAKKKVTK